MSEDNNNEPLGPVTREEYEGLQKQVRSLQAALALALKPEHRPENIEDTVLEIVERKARVRYDSYARLQMQAQQQQMQAQFLSQNTDLQQRVQDMASTRAPMGIGTVREVPSTKDEDTFWDKVKKPFA